MSLILYYGNQLVNTIESVSYSTNMDYAGDLVTNYYYTVTLAGYCIANPADDNSFTSASLMNKMLAIKNIFNNNGSSLKIYNANNNQLILLANDGKIKNINFEESSNNWTKYIPFSVEIDFNHLHMGDDLANTLSSQILQGADDPNLADNFYSPKILNIENHKIKTFSENFTMDINDSDIFNQINLTNDLGITISRITNNYFSISYNLSATGKHDITNIGGVKTTLPAWENAKRYVHRRLVYQINSMFSAFLSVNTSSSLNNIHGYTSGAGSIDLTDPLGGAPAFGIYNETMNFDVSESEGKFSVQYNAIVKHHCPTIQSNVGCYNPTIHTVNKSINRSFRANEETNMENQEITITVDGEIRGLVPGRGVNSSAPFIIADPDGAYKGTFLIKQNTLYDKNDYANQLLLSIFNPITYDFTDAFKIALGITPSVLAVNPYTILKPSRMNLTRNFLQGTINYAAEYNNKFNCATNHFEVNLTVDMPVPVVAEFVIPNNNIQREDGTVCASGYSVVQKLGTYTAKKISVSINGNEGFDYGKCCLGSSLDTSGPCDGGDIDLLALNYFSAQDFLIPSGVIIPIIGNNYVLTNKQRKTTFPKGNFSISLEYICADVCEDHYFQKG